MDARFFISSNLGVSFSNKSLKRINKAQDAMLCHDMFKCHVTEAKIVARWLIVKSNMRIMRPFLFT